MAASLIDGWLAGLWESLLVDLFGLEENDEAF